MSAFLNVFAVAFLINFGLFKSFLVFFMVFPIIFGRFPKYWELDWLWNGVFRALAMPSQQRNVVLGALERSKALEFFHNARTRWEIYG